MEENEEREENSANVPVKSCEAQFSQALAKFKCYYKAQTVSTVKVCDLQIERSANPDPTVITLIT